MSDSLDLLIRTGVLEIKSKCYTGGCRGTSNFCIDSICEPIQVITHLGWQIIIFCGMFALLCSLLYYVSNYEMSIKNRIVTYIVLWMLLMMVFYLISAAATIVYSVVVI